MNRFPPALAALVLAAALLFAPVAQAAAPPQLWQTPTVGSDAPGFAAGQFATPQGIGVNPNNGHLYVADLTNNRIDELSAWGVFVKAFGWGVRDGAEELETCTAETTCQKGIKGAGAGQIGEPYGVAVDDAGNVYVDEPFRYSVGHQERTTYRVQKFSSTGEFLLTFGGGVITGGAAGTGDLSSGSKSVTSVTATTKAFEEGQTITGTGIPPETRIVAVGVGTLTLSEAATASGSGVALTVAEGTGNAPANERQRIVLSGSPTATGGSFSLTLPAGSADASFAVGSNQVTATTNASGTFHVGDATNVRSARGQGNLTAGSETIASLSTSQGSFQAGQPISGAGIATGTTIASVGAGTLTLSAPATESGSEVSLTAATKIAAIDPADGSLTLSANASSVPAPEEIIQAKETTAPIPFNATASEVEEALEALSAIGAGDVSITGPAAGPWTAEFEGPLLGDVDVAQLISDSTRLAGPQTITIHAASSSFTLTFNSQTTAPIPSNASAATVQFALEALSTIGAGNVSIAGPGGGPWQVTFTGALAGEAQPKIKISLVGIAEVTAPAAAALTARQGAGAAEICTAAHASDCRGGLGSGSEAEPGQFSAPHRGNENDIEATGTKIAVGPDGGVFVGDRERIEEFEPSGAFKAEIPIPGTSIPEETVQSLAMDGAGNFYAGLWGKEGVAKLDPSGKELHHYQLPIGTLVPAPQTLAADGGGELYVVQDPGSNGLPELEARIVEFGADFAKLIPSQEEEEENAGKDKKNQRFFPETPEKAELLGLATSEACGIEGHDVYVSAFGPTHVNVRAFGPPPQDTSPPCEPPPQVPPTISDSYALSAGADSAVVQAKINPHFWADTTYQVHYGTGKCSEGGCEQAAPASPAQLINRVLDEPVKSAAVNLPGLDPGTTYHYRFVAQSGGGGPVDGPEGTFTTASLPLAPRSECPNQVFRSGPAAALPDCRAYEMVSPVDKNGADIVSLINVNGLTTAFDESAAEGGRLAYSAFRAFGDAQSAPYTLQYIATRHERGSPEEGWTSQALNPPRGLPIYPDGFTVENEFRAFTPDLCRSWLVHDADPTLAPDAIAGFPNVYRRSNCGPQAGTFEAITTAEPPGVKPAGYSLDLQGASADGSHTVFQAAAKLTPNANAGANAQCYESVGEGSPLRLLSVLPNGSASEADCSLGTDDEIGLGNSGVRSATLDHAISTDGQRIYWSASPAKNEGGPGQIYLRKEGKDPTIEVSGAVSKTAAARFLAAAADGSRAIFQIEDREAPQDGNLYEFNAAKAKATLIAPRAIGLLGASEDASRLYFASEAALGGGAVEGKPNLYFREGTKAPRFVATLSAADADRTVNCDGCFSPLAFDPIARISTVSPDGLHAIFMSSASLTGFDNTDANSGEADAEVYLYDASANAGAGQLLCVSCDPSGVRPAGRELPYTIHQKSHTWAAAQIPHPTNQVYAPRVLSANGSHLFFESYEPLVLRDTDNRQDVYEWERSESAEECEEDGAELYAQANGGCLSLISSGKSSQDSELLDISADGTDAFFTTGSSLVSQDPGLIDVYDARTEGGFPPPPALREECEGQACQPTLEAPNDPTPASSAFEGAGNVAGEPKPSSCRKPRVRRKGRCVTRKHKSARRHHRANVGAGVD